MSNGTSIPARLLLKSCLQQLTQSRSFKKMPLIPSSLPKRKLGNSNGQEISSIGFGAMGLSAFYVGGVDDESLKVLTHAADLGCTFWDTSDLYGPHTNEKLIGRWFKETGRRNEIFLATKFGATFEGARGSANYVKKSIRGPWRDWESIMSICITSTVSILQSPSRRRSLP